jgi:hypothetical protein
MTLADLCTSLIERESVIHSFRNTASPVTARVNVSQERITEVAKALKTFTRRELITAAGCAPGAVQHWVSTREGKSIVECGRVVINGGWASVWRWR